MTKISVPISNDYCPQTLYLYGTYGADGEPSFGLFCWASWCRHEGQLCFMAAIGEPKHTQDRIRANGVFSANLVTESLLPFADRMGNLSGRNGGKRDVAVAVEKGRVLDVPILAASPVSFELEVFRTVELGEGSVLFLSRIRNVLHDESLTDAAQSPDARLAAIRPVSTTNETYYGWDGRPLGAWGAPGKGGTAEN